MILPSLVLLATLAQVGEQPPGPPHSPQALFDEARALFNDSKYEEAVTKFSRLVEETGDAIFLGGLAQSLRLAGRCDDALGAYERFVAAEPALRARVEMAPPGSGLKRIVVDLEQARGRIVEMRICRSRTQVVAAKQAAKEHLASGNPTTAITLLQQAWATTQNPTLLTEMAEIQRQRQQCQAAKDLLDVAIKHLQPVEELRAIGASSADVDEAVDALQKAQEQRNNLACVQMNTTEAPKAMSPPNGRAGGKATSAVTLSPALSTATPAVKPTPVDSTLRWVRWTTGGSLLLLTAGSTSLLLAHKAATDLRGRLATESWDEDKSESYNRGKFYNSAGVALVSAGAGAGVAAVALYLLRSKEEGAVTPTFAFSDRSASWQLNLRF